MLRDRRAHDPRPSADRRRAEHGAAALRALLAAPTASTSINPHLHNVPLQIAAERGLPALAVWLWFIVALARDLWTLPSASRERELAATAMATVVALLTAGLFEYNFGDSEVLMLFLTIVTLPAAAARPPS